MTQISVRESGDVAILDLRGRWTIDGSELLNRHLQKLLDNGVRKILLNLANVNQIDSSAVSSMVRMRISLHRQGGDVRLLRPSKHAMDVLRVLHVPITIKRVMMSVNPATANRDAAIRKNKFELVARS